jgi:hypothetical protein
MLLKRGQHESYRAQAEIAGTLFANWHTLSWEVNQVELIVNQFVRIEVDQKV